MTIKSIGTAVAPLTIREVAEKEVREEAAKRAIGLMKGKLRDLASAKAVIAGIELDIADLEAQIADGTF